MRQWSKGAVDTGHKTFDAQSNYIGTGAVAAPTQYSNHIRAFTETVSAGRFFDEGQLQAYDIQGFGPLPRPVRDAVRRCAQDETVILYRFAHRDGGEAVVHGFLLTRAETRQHELLHMFVTGPTNKSAAIVRAMAEFVSNPPGTCAKFENEILPRTVAEMKAHLARQPEDLQGAIRGVAAALAGSPDHETWAVWRDLGGDLHGGLGTEAPLAAAGAALDSLPEERREMALRVMASLEDMAHRGREGLSDRVRAVRMLVEQVAAGPGLDISPGASGPRR